MSMVLVAFLSERNVPAAKDWQSGVGKLGFDLKIDSELKPLQDSGFLPCKLAGRDTGFEIYYGPAERHCSELPHIRNAVGNRECAIVFRWGGNMVECACAQIASAALAQSFDALVYSEDEDKFVSVEELVRSAVSALAEG